MFTSAKAHSLSSQAVTDCDERTTRQWIRGKHADPLLAWAAGCNFICVLVQEILKNPTEDLSYEMAFAPSRDFKYEAAMSRLQSLSLDIFPQASQESVNENERMLRLGALIDFDWYSLPSPQFPFIPASLILFMQERGSDGCRWAVAGENLPSF